MLHNTTYMFGNEETHTFVSNEGCPRQWAIIFVFENEYGVHFLLVSAHNSEYSAIKAFNKLSNANPGHEGNLYIGKRIHQDKGEPTEEQTND